MRNIHSTADDFYQAGLMDDGTYNRICNRNRRFSMKDKVIKVLKYAGRAACYIVECMCYVLVVVGKYIGRKAAECKDTLSK